MIKNKASLIDTLLGFALIMFFFSSIVPVSGPGARYYAGGYWTTSKWGVSAEILTIYPYIPPYQFMAQWDTIIVNYYPLYWVQLGYIRYRDYTVTKTQTYREKMDKYGHDLHFFVEVPSRGSWHTYRIAYQAPPDGKYQFTIDGNDRGYYVIDPYDPDELQAFVETTTTSIKIEDSYYGPSHFDELRYRTDGSWNRWTSLTTYVDSPYWINKISNYEFKAGGGG